MMVRCNARERQGGAFKQKRMQLQVAIGACSCCLLLLLLAAMLLLLLLLLLLLQRVEI